VQGHGGFGLDVLRHLRQQARVGRLLALLAGVGAVALIASQEARIARHKLFWTDEGHEIAEACGASYASLLLHGARPQVNPAPLYFILEKLAVGRVARFDESILVSYRVISLGSAALTLAALYGVVLLRLGTAPALFALGSLASQPLFHRYAAENRPYMVWLFCFTVAVLAIAGAASRPWSELGRLRRIALSAACIALSMAALPGALQAAAGLAVCATLWHREPLTSGRGFWWWLMPLAGAALALGFWYGGATSWTYEASHLDLLRSRDPGRLLAEVFALLVPPNAESLGGHALVLAGLAVFFRRATAPRSRPGHYARVLAFVVAAELALTLVLGLEVVRRGYYFIPRLFLYLMVCRALLVALGAWAALAAVERVAGPRLRLAATSAAVAIGCLGVAFAVDRLAAEAGETRAAYPPWPATSRCAAGEGTLILDTAPGVDPAVGPNVVVRLGEERRRCGWRSSPETHHVLALSERAAEGWYRLSSERLPGAVPLEQCGRPVVVGP
jgi:hypothetical protein